MCVHLYMSGEATDGKMLSDDKKHVHVTFLWESAVDGGGPRREFFMLLMNAIKENNSVRRCLHQTCSTSPYNNITRRALPMYGQNDSPIIVNGGPGDD